MKRPVTTIPKSRAALQSNPNTGLLANGSAGPWDVDIDESLAGVDRWWIQIEGPSASFYFEVSKLAVVGEMADFLRSRESRTKPPSNGSLKPDPFLKIGGSRKEPIRLVKDDEYEDRYYFAFGPPKRPVARFVISGADVDDLANALQQVLEDLE